MPRCSQRWAAADRPRRRHRGAPQYTFTASPPLGVTFTADINSNHSTCTAGPEPLRAATELTFGTDGNIVGGRLIYCTVNAARSAGLVLHEIGHTLGMYHSPAAADVMYCTTGRPVDFSSRERLVMKLMRLRRSGNRYPDNNDRQAFSPLTVHANATNTIMCGGPR